MPTYQFAVDARVAVEADGAEEAEAGLAAMFASRRPLPIRDARYAALAIDADGLPLHPARFLAGWHEAPGVGDQEASIPRSDADEPYLSGEALVRYLAAEDDTERRYKLAGVMLAAKQTENLDEIFHHAVDAADARAAGDGERAAGRAVLDTLPGLLLTRVRVMDDAFEGFLDRLVERDLADGELDPPHAYDPEEGLTWPLEPVRDDPEDRRDLALDLRAADAGLYLTMRVVAEGGGLLEGWVPAEEVPRLRRYLDIVAADAEAMAEDEGEEDAG